MASNIATHSGEIDDNTEILQFNLTNPEQLCEQLKHADLNDDETDMLLKEAMKVNAQLKEALRIQQIEEEQKPRSDRARASFGPPEPLAPRNPKKSSLPPIVSKSDKSHGGGGSQGQKNSKSKSKSVLDGQRGASASKRKGSATKPKPPWDDRFSFD